MKRDVVIILLVAVLAWYLLAESVNPIALAQERAWRHEAESQATLVVARADRLATLVATLATPTPLPWDCRRVHDGC